MTLADKVSALFVWCTVLTMVSLGALIFSANKAVPDREYISKADLEQAFIEHDQALAVVVEQAKKFKTVGGKTKK